MLPTGRAAREIGFNQSEAATCSSDVILRGKQWWRRKMSAVFSGLEYSKPRKGFLRIGQELDVS